MATCCRAGFEKHSHMHTNKKKKVNNQSAHIQQHGRCWSKRHSTYFVLIVACKLALVESTMWHQEHPPGTGLAL